LLKVKVILFRFRFPGGSTGGLWYQLEVALSAIDIAAFLFSAVLIFLLAIRLRHQLYLPVTTWSSASLAFHADAPFFIR
jgi:thiosulfate reductase cytochrome b subunit